MSRLLGLEHAPLEERVLADGQEMMRLFTQAHLDLRAARESRREDVVDADGDARVTVEDGQGHNRMMVYGTVRTNRLAYKRYRKTNLYPADRDLNWGGTCTRRGWSSGSPGGGGAAVRAGR